MSDIRFSIIMPVYNREGLVAQAIASVLAQKYEQFELICVDDGSTDHSADVIRSWQQKDTRIRFVQLERNKGRCIARNTGIEQAKEKWICFLDSDDIYLPDHLEVLTGLISGYPEHDLFATNQKNSSERKQLSPTDSITRIIFTDTIAANPLHNLNQLCYNKEKIKTLFPNENIQVSEDWLFIRELTMVSDLIKTNRITAEITEHKNRTMIEESFSSIAHWNLYTAEYFIRTNTISNNIRKKILSHTLLLCANMLLSSKEKKKSLPYFTRSLSSFSTFTNLLFYKALIKFII